MRQPGLRLGDYHGARTWGYVGPATSAEEFEWEKNSETSGDIRD